MTDPRTHRIPIMLSDAELKAIDDWRFANRVESRSEAIRQLCEIATYVSRSAQNGGAVVIQPGVTMHARRQPEGFDRSREFMPVRRR